jgi:hypothetical protein
MTVCLFGRMLPYLHLRSAQESSRINSSDFHPMIHAYTSCPGWTLFKKVDLQ